MWGAPGRGLLCLGIRMALPAVGLAYFFFGNINQLYFNIKLVVTLTTCFPSTQLIPAQLVFFLISFMKKPPKISRNIMISNANKT